MAKKRVGKFPKAFRQMAVDRLKQCDNIVELAKELGIQSAAVVYVAREARAAGARRRTAREFTRGHAPERGQPTQAGAGREGLGGGFFQRCLAQRRGATPAERHSWRAGIYAHIRDVMSRQGGLSIERMCQLAQVSRAGFYRSLQEAQPVEEEMAVRSGHSGDRRRTSASVWLSAHHGGTAPAWAAGQPQTGRAAHAGRQPARRSAAGLRGHDRCRITIWRSI